MHVQLADADDDDALASSDWIALTAARHLACAATVRGLTPSTDYAYRVELANRTRADSSAPSPRGRFRSWPAANASLASLR